MKAAELILKIGLLDSTARLNGAAAKSSVKLKGVSGSLPAFLAAQLPFGNPIVVVGTDRDSASYFYNDLYNILSVTGNQNRVMLLPTAYKRAINTDREDASGIVQRTAVLSAINNAEPVIICTWAAALAEKVVSREKLDENRLTIALHDKLSMDFVRDVLDSYLFESVDFVSAPGQYAIRGGIFDIFSFAGNQPYRLDFLGDTVDTIRTFNVNSQLTDCEKASVEIIPNLKNRDFAQKRISITKYIGANATVWFVNAEQTLAEIEAIRLKMVEGGASWDSVDEVVTSRAEFLADSASWRYIYQSSDIKERKADIDIDFNSFPQPSFGKNFSLLSKNINENYEQGVLTYLLTPNEDQMERLDKILAETNSEPIGNIALTLHQGFILPAIHAALYTDHQIFERYLRYTVHGEIDKAQGMTLAEFSALKVGDYIVHIDHGVGRFGGLVRQRDGDNVTEFIKLAYRDGDVLFVGVHNLHRISKFKDGDTLQAPTLQKLGSGAWAKLKESTKRKVKDIARELIELYAKRKASRGFGFSPDSYMQKELEASFIYEDTPDQRATTDAIKIDMEATEPMDRLVCGDVGFGKTEIAIRAAFKAATDGKQVAVLVPTTVLSLQHFRTFSRRLKDFPVRIENFSRTKSAKQVTEILADLEAGKVDIIIGTHKLLGKTVKFKDLGLLIVDEEQKFGVAMKERLKELKYAVDTLTLTATPIPRTLQFSLMGARDMSIISTPPPNRQPVSTEVVVYDQDIIRDAVEYELSRGGQVFVLHNRVQTISRVAATIEKLVPGARVAVGHGQMAPAELEKVMMDFIYGQSNVLVATTIIESGIDIPNANTIIINNAQNFGLSDLHQLRGRVGRTNRKAFCYLLIPSTAAVSGDAHRRLRAIEEFADLGSGFNIAMQDLDIRGAGNILGAEQSGFITEIGYDTYQKIVAQAMAELQDEMGIELSQRAPVTVDCVVESDTSAHLPDSYIGSTSEKLKLYRELDDIGDEKSLAEFISRLRNRFGEPPRQACELFDVVLLRANAAKLGFEKVIIKNGGATLYFAAPPQSPYYAGATFAAIMAHVLANPMMFKLKEGQKLSLAVRAVGSIEKLRKLLEIKNV